MKKLVLLALLAMTANIFAQTKIIALKRHSATIENINSEQAHNFGEYNARFVDTIVYVGKGVVVEKGSYTFQGRFEEKNKSHRVFSAYTYSAEEIKKMFGNTTVLINLELYEKERKKELKNVKKSSPRWLVLLLPLLFFAKPKKRMC